MQKIYFGGDIITMRNRKDAPEAVLIADEKILYVGALSTARDQAVSAVEVDLKGRTLMPAFLDGHSHISTTAQMCMLADLSNCTDFGEIVTDLKQYKEENHLTEQDMLVGWGYDHNFLKEETHPTKEILDQVSETMPIFITHISSHMGCANSAALRLANITANTENPQGGAIGRIDETDEPNGYLEENGMTAMYEVMQRHMKVDMEEGLKRAQTLYLKYGITTVQDGASNEESITLMKNACDKGQFFLDVVSYPVVSQGNVQRYFEQYAECNENYHNHFKLGGHKIVLDGSPQGKSAWMTKPYEHSGDNRGYSWFSDETVEEYIRNALVNKKQLLAHCNGDAAADQFLHAYSKALAQVPQAKDADLRPVMIHCQTVRDDQLDVMAKLSMIASIFVGHVFYWGDIHKKNLGQKRGSRISPCKSALERGVIINFHQDTPVTKPDMMHSVWTAVNRITRNGENLGTEQCIDVYEALKAITIQTAYSYHEEHEKGTIEAGKSADLVILSDNPLKVDKQKIRKITVEETIKAGKTLFSIDLIKPKIML